MSATAARWVLSVTTRKCQRWRLRPVGAWVARSTHSSMRWRGTGLVRSSRVRTARVVDRTWSADRFSDIRSFFLGSGPGGGGRPGRRGGPDAQGDDEGADHGEATGGEEGEPVPGQ